jgi:hypothetical protein
MAGVRITQLEPGGTPGRRYGSFAGKPSSDANTHPVGRITQLWPYGGPGRRYGSFDGKAGAVGPHPVGRITQLWPYGGPGKLYGLFLAPAGPLGPTGAFSGKTDSGGGGGGEAPFKIVRRRLRR